jgi:TRAP-type C4-dicarboxylate transport system permease small subunit
MMLRALVRLKEALTRLLEGLLVLLMALLVLDVLWQVASRYLLRRPESWTDEMATLLVIWVALLGSSVASGRGSHLGVDYFTAKLPPRARLATELAAHLLVLAFALTVLFWGGAKLVALTLLTGQVSPALGVKMGYVYLALPVSGGFIALFALEAVALRLATGTRNREEVRR